MEETTSNGTEAETKKKKGLMIGVVVGILILLAGFLVVRGSGKNKTMMDGVVSDEKEAETMPSKDAVKMSFQDLLGGGKSQKCTFSDESDMSKSEGTFYVSDGKGRATLSSTDLSDKNAGMTTRSNMIFDTESNTMYFWNDATKQGMKMAMSQKLDSPAMEKDTANGTPIPSRPEDVAKDFNHKYSYDCNPWTADEAMFAVPSDVVFTDVAEMMKALPVPSTLPGMVPPESGSLPMSGTDTKALQCSACEQAGDQMAACKKALGCE
ncbi:MAG: hypothetical protein WBC29_01410 [Candidatus Moraniibacteriota bacterium]